MAWAAQHRETDGSEQRAKCYDLPIGMPWLRYAVNFFYGIIWELACLGSGDNNDNNNNNNNNWHALAQEADLGSLCTLSPHFRTGEIKVQDES